MDGYDCQSERGHGFHEILQHRAATTATCAAFHFLGSKEETLTYGELHSRAACVAGQLLQKGMAGARVLLLFPPGLDYISALFGCLYAGCVAVPAYPPRNLRQMPRIRSIVADAQATCVLTTSFLLHKLEGEVTGDFKWICIDAVHREVFDELNRRAPRQQIAILQYTSGSTGVPKGVMLTHENLLHNSEHIRRRFQCTEDSVCVIWLPPYHDMGLIGGIMQPLYSGFPCVLLSPAAFAQQPAAWLSAISRFGGTISGGPNFAYDLCVERIAEEQLAELDLSTWTVAFNGAEAVRAETMRRFADRFAPYGFRSNAFLPCYGLAEATLLVTAGRWSGASGSGGNVASEKDPVSCGVGLDDQRVAIVDPDRRIECLPAMEGEIWISGASVARGYWGQPRLTDGTFYNVKLEGDAARSNATAYLRTGDLGYVRDGELFVTGRMKDVINLGGRKFHPQDIEATAQASHGALRGAAAVAFSIEADNTEQLIVAQELAPRFRGDAECIIDSIRQSILLEHEILAHIVLLLKVGSIPRTSSGKVRRGASREMFLQQEFAPVANSMGSSGEVEQALAAIWRELLQVERVGRHDDFFELGGHSLLATQLVSRIRQRLGVEIELRELFERSQLAALSQAIESGVRNALPPIVRANHHGPLPLSYAQQRLWFIDRLEGGGGAYHIAGAVRLQGVLDRAALQATLDTLIERHEALRTVFASVEGGALQVIVEPRGFALRWVDLGSLDEQAREREVRHQALEEAGAPFDLSVGPLIRGRLLRLSEQAHVLLVTMHHIVSDGWSMGVLIREVAILYAAYREGRSHPLAALPIQYADYAVWQRGWLQGEMLEGQLGYWKQELSGAAALLELPADRVRSTVQSYRGDSVEVELGAELSGQLKVLSRQHDATLFMTLYTGFAMLLSRLSGQDDIVIGVPVANRQRTEVEGLIGFFVNTLALRVRVSGEASVGEVLKQVKVMTLSGYSHQEIPFEQVVEALQPLRSLSHSPVFQVMLVLQNAPQEELELPGLRLVTQELSTGTEKFDLTLSLREVGERIVGDLSYASDLFDRGTIERWVEYLRAVLGEMVSDAQRAVGALRLLSEGEREQLIHGFNATRVEYPRDQLIHELFEEQVARTPEAVAVVYEKERLSYGELNRRANRLARYLRARGVGLDERVGLCVERSVEMVVGLLGILKAGAAYVPLDPSYPAERLEYMLRDAAPRVLLTQERLRASMPATSAEVVTLDGQWEEIAAQSEANLAAVDLGLTPAHLAYVIYTSGSTGVPKGVMVEQGSVVNLLSSMQRQPGINASDRLLALTTLSFDIAGLEIYLPLISGAQVVIASREVAADAIRLAAMMKQSGVTVVQATPATWRLLLSMDWPGQSSLKALCGGEALSVELSHEIESRVEELWNLYGPTETTIWSCARQVRRGQGASHGTEMIGRPIANTQMYILDSHRQPVPIGVAGEIYIGGAGVARGYLNLPELTAQRFIRGPFSAYPAARMYKTGDRGRWRADGNIEYLGRNDHQVKIRGYRIELGEIESRLMRHEQVREAVVIAREDEPGEKRLVAYVTAREGEQAPSADELWVQLSKQLPGYMMPAALVMLDVLPLTPNRKVDRKALPVPDGSAQLHREYEAPQGEVEQALAGIWQELLGVPLIGRNDNFFELGGHSLTAVQCVARARDVLERKLVLRDMFEFPTLHALAGQLSNGLPDSLPSIEIDVPDGILRL